MTQPLQRQPGSREGYMNFCGGTRGQLRSTRSLIATFIFGRDGEQAPQWHPRNRSRKVEDGCDEWRSEISGLLVSRYLGFHLGNPRALIARMCRRCSWSGRVFVSRTVLLSLDEKFSKNCFSFLAATQQEPLWRRSSRGTDGVGKAFDLRQDSWFKSIRMDDNLSGHGTEPIKQARSGCSFFKIARKLWP